MSDDDTKDSGRLFKAWINPLQFVEAEAPWADLTSPPTLEDAVRFLCTPELDHNLGALLERFREISTEPKRLFAAPAEQRILDKLIWPLRHAKAGYMIGNFLGTISLCGMVAEMIAVLLFSISEVRLNQQSMSEPEERALFGNSFEKLGQQRRVEVLAAYGLIDQELKTSFDLIRTTRRRYLHLWSQDHDSLPRDAIACYQAAVTLAIRVIGQDLDQGKILLNPALVAYLERSGVFNSSDDPAA